MKELDFINIIKKQLDFNCLLGDDCAYLDDLNIFITQDTLVEDVHFSMYTTSPYMLGKKTVSVNLSDLAAALAKPMYISVSLSLPSHIKSEFVSELYKGINEVCSKYNVKVSGGDITGSDKIVISVCAIGKKVSNYLTSRSYAKQNDCIITTGSFGTSGAGLYALLNFLYCDDELKNAQLNPNARIKESEIIREIIDSNIAVMDTSDGLADALYKIAQASKHTLEIDMSKIPVSDRVIEFAKHNNLDYKNLILWGAEDFELVFCAKEEIYNQLDKNLFTLIGKVQNKDINPLVIVKDENESIKIDKNMFENKSYNHFER